MFLGGSTERIKMINYKSCSRWRQAVALVTLTTLATLISTTEAEVEAGKSQANDKFKEVKIMQPQMGAEQVQEAYYADGWSPHSLEPTFTDQEQGDEMVALAAEPEPYVTRVLANNKTTLHQEASSTRNAAMILGEQLKETGSRARVQQPQEYYSDEYGTEDENEQAKFGANDYGSVPYAFERKETKQQTQHSPERANKNRDSPDNSTPIQTDDKSSSWLPRVQNQLSVSTTAAEQQQQPEKVNQQKQHQLSSIFSRDSLKAFGKTEAAIEYLRNVLHMKQSLQSSNNSSRPVIPAVASLPSTLNLTRANNKQENLQKLSLFASRLTQLLNNVTASQTSALSVQKLTTTTPAINDNEFKIADAKHQQPQVQTIASAIQPQPASNDFHNYEYDQVQVDTPTGTPVGGDYNESQDDFLRGSSSFLQNAHVLPEPVSLEQSESKTHLTPYDSSHIHQSYALPLQKPQELRYDIAGLQLPSMHASSSRYFRLGQPEPAPAAPQPAHLSSRLPLNYQQQQQQLNAKQALPYHVLENKKAAPYAVKNDTEAQVSDKHSSRIRFTSTEPSRRPLQSKIYGYDRQPQSASRERYLPKSPKIVSYNYFESPNDAAGRDSLATNFKLGDALYSSTGSLEHMLSNSELEAIQNQFVSSEHPVVGVNSHHEYGDSGSTSDTHLASLLDSLKSDPLRVEASDKKPVTETAHNVSVVSDFTRDLDDLRQKGVPQAVLPLHLQSTTTPTHGHLKQPKKDGVDDDAKKNLIVYLNHPRPIDMSGSKTVKTETDQYVAAKEFDSQGVSKDNKYLDVADLNDYSELKDLQDKNKDGLSVVVIGDAYKYKKIVLLISSKAGGLKFIPMVKDNRK